MCLRHHQSRGFTLVELLVVIAIIGVLIALLLPAVQQAREAARRSQCSNNMKQIGLALHLYHDSFNSFPIGARSGTAGGQNMGPSWWAGLLPYFEQTAVYDAIDFDVVNSGFVGNNQKPQLMGISFSVMQCPSYAGDLGGYVAAWSATIDTKATYAGISGAVLDTPQFTETRTATCCSCCASTGLGSSTGIIAAGGLLVPNAAFGLKNATDGTSNTIIVGEIGGKMATALSSGGLDPSAIPSPPQVPMTAGGNPHGWLMGSEGNTPLPSGGLFARVWNLTTVRYAPNSRNYDRDGISVNAGANNPLQSEHPGGVTVLSADGHVSFVPATIDLNILKSLATRDDGAVIGGY